MMKLKILLITCIYNHNFLLIIFIYKNIFLSVVEKFINKNSNTFIISINFKMGLESPIDKPKELLELIN
jgi:hypothetical protein